MDVPEIDVEALGPRHAAGAAVLDVRQPDEYREAHVPGSRLIPLGELPERVGEVEAGGEVYVICRSGNRSRKAAQYLRQHGIDATNVAGGILAWVQAGKPTTSGDQPA